MSVEVEGNFVSEKINKIRWIPEEYGETKTFVTGSWDNEVNSVRTWTFEADDQEVDYPKELNRFELKGDVTEMRIIDKTGVVVTSSAGSVKLLTMNVYDLATPLKDKIVWENLHKYSNGDSCSCTCAAVLDADIATAGEDGNIHLLNTRSTQPSRSIHNADSCAIHSICFLKHNEVLTGNLRGHMKIWDIRSSDDKPSASFLLSGEQLAATCVVNHPTQRHLVLAGNEGGALAVWDLRVNTYPASLLSAHSTAVSEIQFHPDNAQRLFTCSASGELWDWNTSAMTKTPRIINSEIINESKSNPWLSLEDNKSKMEIVSLMSDLHKPINTLDCNRNRLLCGCDNEAIYLVKNISV